MRRPTTDDRRPNKTVQIANRSADQPINDQSTNGPMTNRPIDHSTNRPFDQQTIRPTDHLTNRSAGQPTTIRLFLELTKRSFQRHLTYRAAAIAGLATNLFFGLLRAAVLIALYGAREQVAGVSVAGAITYTGLTQAVIAYLSIFGWYALMESVNTGEVGSDLLKPMGFFRFWLAKDLGRAGVNFLLRGVSIMLIYALIFDIVWPASLFQWLALAVAIVLSWLVSFSWYFLVNLAAFWTPNARGVGRFAFGVSWILSGFFMPLRFFPDWFVTLAKFTPFPAMVNTVVEIYLGVLPGPACLLALLEQGLWCLILIGLGQLVLRAGVRRLVIQGG